MPSFVVLQRQEPEDEEADAVRDAAEAVADIRSTIRRIELVLAGEGDPQYATLLAAAAVRITEGAVAAEEAYRAIVGLEARRAADKRLAAAAYRRGRAEEAASRRLSAVPPARA